MSRNGYHDDLVQVLEKLPCARVSYEEWLKIGMALKSVGLPVSVWDNWSRTDSVRYHEGECQKKWRGFKGQGVSSGTIIEIAKRYGHDPNKECQGDDGNELLDWDSTFEYVPDPSDQETTDKDLTPTTEEEGTADVIPMLPLPKPGEVFPDGEFKPTREVKSYLQSVFKEDDVVNYVPSSFRKKDKKEEKEKYIPLPTFAKTVTLTAKELADLLDKSDKELPAELKPRISESGAWIRINPINPDAIKKGADKAVEDEDVSAYRNALVECDDMPPEEQYSRIKSLDLPIAIMVNSGGKSLHAVVKIDAKDEAEYRERVRFLHDYCLSNGLKLDKANKNPSRLTRIPGVMRGDKPQYIVEFESGKASWLEWRKAVDPNAKEVKKAEEEAKKAEEAETAKEAEETKRKISCVSIWDVLKAPPKEETPDLIQGILKPGSKAIVQSESKAGKSFLMIELALAFATGGELLKKYRCAKSNVMLLNLELKEDDYYKRFRNVISKMGIHQDENTGQILVQNLRGTNSYIENIKDALIKSIKVNHIDVLIIDPLYKISNKDENSAQQMSELFRDIDEIVEATGCACIIVHHHPKASSSYSAQNRGSGSGVIARDADAIIDLSEITKGVPEAKNSILRQRKLDYTARKLNTCLGDDWMDTINAQGTDSAELLIEKAKDHLTGEQLDEINQELLEIDKAVDSMTAWLVTFSLREFRTPPPIPVWFDYPIHTIDETGMLNSGNYSANETDQGQAQMTQVQKRPYLFGEALAQAEKDGDLSRYHVVALYNKLAERKGVATLEENTKNPSTIAKYAVANGWTYRTKTKDFARDAYASTEEDAPFSDQLI